MIITVRMMVFYGSTTGDQRRDIIQLKSNFNFIFFSNYLSINRLSRKMIKNL
jgi:hypothetical protein